MDEPEKKIDMGWKDQVAKEKEQAARREGGAGAAERPTEPGEEPPQPPEANFAFFITSLGMQAAVCLGEIADPMTGKPTENLPHAKYLIDTLGILGEKTVGNLTPDESEMLKAILADLRMKYVAKASPQ